MAIIMSKIISDGVECILGKGLVRAGNMPSTAYTSGQMGSCPSMFAGHGVQQASKQRVLAVKPGLHSLHQNQVGHGKQCDEPQSLGRCRSAESTLSVGMLACEMSYKKLFSRICVGSMGRKGRKSDSAAMLNIFP